MSYYREDIAGRLMGDLMSDYDLSREQAAGIVANLAYESSGFKSMQEDKPMIPGSRGGYGYAQWTASRRREFEQFVDEKDWDIKSYQANYGNLKRELDGEYRYVIDLIKDVDTAEQASDIFAKKFERPDPKTAKYARRAKLAADILVNPNAGFIAPYPTARGVSQQTDLVRRQTLDPHSGNMGLVERKEPAWSDQFAPGPNAAPRSAIPHPVRDDYPTGPANPEPWQYTFAPAPQYAHRAASSARFDKTFASSDPQAPPLTPGTSNTGKAVAYRGLAHTMRQAGIGGLDGRAVTQPQVGIDQFGPVHPAHGLSPPPPAPATPRGTPDIDSVPIPRARPPVSAKPEFTPPVPLGRPPGSVPFAPPVPKSRPRSVAPIPAARPFVPTYSTMPIPKPRPDRHSVLPMMPLHHNQMHQRPSSYTGPKKQIFDFVLQQLLNPKGGPK